MILHGISAFFAVVAYALLADAPKKELLFIGLSGTVSWLSYLVCIQLGNNVMASTFVSSLLLTVFCRFLAFNRKTPITIFIVPGFLPLAPGGILYYAMYYTIENNTYEALLQIITALKIAGAITLAMSIVSIIPTRYFNRNIKLLSIGK